MEEFTVETTDPESSDDGMITLPEDAEPDTEFTLSESEEDPEEGNYEPEPDENDGEDSESFENAESDTDEDAGSNSAPDKESGSSEAYPDKPDRPVSSPETVSGNSIDFSYSSGADASTHAAYESGETGSLLLIEVMERQNDILYAGFMSTVFILGIILGVLIIHGFRLRRV